MTGTVVDGGVPGGVLGGLIEPPEPEAPVVTPPEDGLISTASAGESTGGASNDSSGRGSVGITGAAEFTGVSSASSVGSVKG